MSPSGFHVYQFGVYRTESLLNGTATYAARHIVVRSKSPVEALHTALELAKRTDDRACLATSGSIIFPHGRQAGVCWILDLEDPIAGDEEKFASKEIGRKVSK